MVFHSKWEYKRWQMLLRRFHEGKIHGLQRQHPIRLKAPNGETVSTYRADFVYIENGVRVIEDAKGHKTTMYKLKRKWIRIQYGIIIRETYAKRPETW